MVGSTCSWRCVALQLYVRCSVRTAVQVLTPAVLQVSKPVHVLVVPVRLQADSHSTHQAAYAYLCDCCEMEAALVVLRTAALPSVPLQGMHCRVCIT